MPSIQSTTFIPISQAEKLIAQNQALNTFNRHKEEAIKVVEDLRSKGFDMSVGTVFGRNLVWMRSWGVNPKSVEEQIMNTKREDLLTDLKRQIAYCALRQLGAVYCVEAKGGWGEYNSFRYNSPTLGGIELLDDFSFFTNFDPDVVFKDIPLLIEKSQALAKTLKEKNLVVN